MYHTNEESMTSGAFDQSHYTQTNDSLTMEKDASLDRILNGIIDYAPYAIALCLPIRLSWTYAVLIPSLLCWIYARRQNLGSIILSSSKHPLVQPLVIFWLYCIFSASVGLAPLQSIHSIAKICFYLLLIPFILDARSHRSPLRIMMFLLTGHLITSFHSVLAAGFPEIIPSMFVGTVTESGQLSLSLILALGLLYIQQSKEHHLKRHHVLIGTALFVFCCALAFADLYAYSPLLLLAILVPACCLWGYAVSESVKQSVRFSHTATHYSVILCIAIVPMLSAGILSNLKRGPWLGVAISSMIVLLYYLPRLLVPASLLLLGICLGVQPIFYRLSQSLEHFFISGGRSSIWNVGIDLTTRFPLGIGYANSEVLQQYDPSIPAELEHFHNNLLNVLVETGWPGVMLMLWWIARCVTRGFQKQQHGKPHPLLHIISLSLLSLQIAGIVEYNIGDSEVLLLVFLLIGIFILEERASQLPVSDSTRVSNRSNS